MIAGEQKAKEFGLEGSEVLLDVHVGAGQYFLSRKGAIYKVLEWLAPPSEEKRSVRTLQWASGDPREVVEVSAPDGNICVELDVTFTPPEVVWVIGEDIGDLLKEDAEEAETEAGVDVGEPMVEEAGGVGEFDVGDLAEEVAEGMNEAVEDGISQGSFLGPAPEQEQITEAREEGAIEEAASDKPLGKREWVAGKLEFAGTFPIRASDIIKMGMAEGIWDKVATAKKTVVRCMERYAKEMPGVVFADGILRGEEPAPMITLEKASEVLGLDVGLQLVINIPEGVAGEKIENMLQTVKDAVGGNNE